MNDKQDRPYLCSAPGCSQRFQLEEHLIIHRHKHEMTLKFPSVKTDMAYTGEDQTPTPTRFLQNCEEVGLFKEIEEEFLQAEEEEKSKQVHFIAKGKANWISFLSLEMSMGHMMEMMSHRHQATPLQHHHHPPHHQHHHHLHSQPPQHLGGAHSHQFHQSANVSHPQAHRSPPPHLQQGSPPAPPLSVPPQTLCFCSHCSRRRRTVDHDPDERRQKFLERNRAAATRCRQKRKLWVSSLEKKAEELTHTNLQLQNEVTSLRSEVGQLKQILLTHKDCPVTARQREAQGYPSPGSQPHAIQHNSISTSSTTAGGDTGHEPKPGN
uniref:Cyclic AMP-dependent transcription factor ATF-7 n=1 Tax=Mola mola TaxID=94237 RepID=A0A3Q3VRQ3_MOLML